MRLYTISINDKEELAVGNGDKETVYLLSDYGVNFTDMNALISNINETQMNLLKVPPINGIEIPIKDVKLCAPIPRPMQDVICLGINYYEHAVESEKFSHEAFGGERLFPIFFSKRVNEAVATEEEIPSYKDLVDSLDYEAELGVIIGKDAKNVSKEDALEYVFGYTIINDISARNLQTRHKQWYFGKSLDRFTPIGPCIVTRNEIEDPKNLFIRCSVNGELRQNSNTGLMITGIEEVIEILSRGMTLKAGSIIATGTPAGVGMGMQPPQFLKDGDEMICEIEKIGKLVNRISD